MISAFDCYHGDYQISYMLAAYVHVYWLHTCMWLCTCFVPTCMLVTYVYACWLCTCVLATYMQVGYVRTCMLATY